MEMEFSGLMIAKFRVNNKFNLANLKNFATKIANRLGAAFFDEVLDVVRFDFVGFRDDVVNVVGENIKFASVMNEVLIGGARTFGQDVLIFARIFRRGVRGIR